MLQKDPRKRPSADELDKELIPNWQNMLNLSSAHFDSSETQASDSLRSNVYYYSTGTKRKQFYVNNHFSTYKLFSAKFWIMSIKLNLRLFRKIMIEIFTFYSNFYVNQIHFKWAFNEEFRKILECARLLAVIFMF